MLHFFDLCIKISQLKNFTDILQKKQQIWGFFFATLAKSRILIYQGSEGLNFMQKTAFKVFVCSFSVSMLAISVANRAYLHAKSLENSSLNISSKNISLFVKDVNPIKYPVKKIDLSILDETPKIPPLAETDESNDINEDGIIVADELEQQNLPFLYNEEIENQNNDDEDQKIFLADVVYSQDKPLENLSIAEETVYSPEEIKSANIVKTSPTEEVKEKQVVYTEQPEVVKKKIVTEAEENPEIKKEPETSTETKVITKISEPEKPLPLLYNKKNAAPINVNIGKPSDLNHVAMKISDVPIESMTPPQSDSEEKSPDKATWKQMSDNPWVIARSNGVSKNKLAEKNIDSASESEVKKALEIHSPKKGVAIASETVKNLIIPLPDKLAENDDLMPKLAYPEDSSDARKEKAMNALSLKQEKEKEQTKLLTEIEDETEMSMIPPAEEVAEEDVAPKKSLLSSLGSLLSIKPKENTETKNPLKSKLQARRNLRRIAEAKRNIPIAPREIRMSFQANRAEISGQTLKWVQAFASKAAQEDNTYLEVRIDGSRPDFLQQRRLNLLYNILTNKGVEYSKISVVYTTREPNSFILRMINPEQNEKGTLRKTNKLSENHLQW